MKEVSEPVKHKLPLLLDASSSPIHAGIPSEEGWIHLEALDLQALEGLFEATTQVMEKAGRSLREVDAVFFCEGPGSTLGLRLAAALVKTLLWESRGKLPIYAYNALDLAARIPESPPEHLQAPFRKGWRFVRAQEGNEPVGSKQILQSEEALSLFPDSLHLPDPRNPDDPATASGAIPYDLSGTRGLSDLRPVSNQVDSPEVYSPKPPSFRKWKPSRTPAQK